MIKKSRTITHCESKSLWNYTLSPGWSDGEVTILKKALMKFGIGRWKKIIESSCLPGKSIGQIYMQTQRLIGQQSLGDFMGLQVDLERIFKDNSLKKDVKRKNNCIINTGDNPSKEERRKKIAENKAKYGLSAEFIRAIKLPRYAKGVNLEIYSLEEIESDKFSTFEKLKHLTTLKRYVDRRVLQFRSKKGGKGEDDDGDGDVDDEDTTQNQFDPDEPVIINVTLKDGKWTAS